MRSLVIPQPGESLMSIAKRCDALYICPKEGGVRKGPLVPYAGKDAQGRNLVGDIYFNFRKIERHPMAVEAFAMAAAKKLGSLIDTFDTVCGIPNGGRSFGMPFARITGKQSVYPEKEAIPTAPRKKQEYGWNLSQFEFGPGERVAVAEDVCNNFQNTDSTLDLVAKTGAEVTLLVCALNRSPTYEMNYTPKKGLLAGKRLPIIASIREAYPEYTQDHPAVAADMAADNIEWEAKKNWARLCAFMQ